LSSIGIVGGVVIGSLLLWFQHRFGLIQLPINGGESIILPVKLSVADYLSVIIVSYVLTFISVILPLKRLKEINAVELIRRTV
jgi:ABC-type lipoprotein release transport system permease subunit